uniref:Cytochrome c oxidase subunit 7C, mitochondrial n=1 Tax=Serinus canaria TaxID=9135 RepID=A0A8C9NHE2_SERCA
MLSAGVRRFAASAIRRSHVEEGPGKNLPFSVDNKWKLLAMMCVFFGSGFGRPFLHSQTPAPEEMEGDRLQLH